MVFTARSAQRYVLWLQLIVYAALCGEQVFQIFTQEAPPDQWLTWFGVSAGFIVLLYATVGFGVFLLLRNARRRARASRGRPDLAPLARLDAPLAPMTPPTTWPVAMRWLPTLQRLNFSVAAGSLTFMSAMCLALGGFFLAVPTLFPGSANPTGMLVLFGGMGAVLAVAGLLLLWFAGVSVRRAIRSPQPVGIVADELGIHQLRGPIRERLVRWEDARLIEVATGSTGSRSRIFTVFAQRGRVTWTMPPPAATPAEVAAFQVAHGQLLALLRERAHLEPRTFERSLRADRPVKVARAKEAVARAPGQKLSLAARLASLPVVAITFALALVMFALLLAICAFFAGLLLAMAWACLAAPLTPIPALNGYAAAATAAPLLLFVRFLASVLLAPLRRKVPLPYLPPAPQAKSYELRWRTPTPWRVLYALVGVPLLPAGALGVWAFIQWSISQFSPPGTTPPPIFILIAVAGPICASLFGGVLLARAITGTPRVIRADERGLIITRNRRLGPEVFPWEDIKEVTLTRIPLGRPLFAIRGRELAQAATWPAISSAVPSAPDADGTQPITPTELAALVVARTELPLRVKSE